MPTERARTETGLDLSRKPGALGTEALTIVALVVACWLLFLLSGGRKSEPAEDAAMLMRYAENVAHGLGVVWNPGEHPLDGATDLLFMLLTAGLVRIGLTVESAVFALDATAIVFIAAGTYLFLHRFHRLRPLTSLFVTAFVLTTPVFRIAQLGFGTPVFVCSVMCVWMLVEVVARQPDGAFSKLALAVSIVVAGLVRPEGFLVGTFALLSILISNGRRSLRGVVLIASLVGAAGVLFVVWRWHYFGYPLPNPFYKKGGGHLHLDGLKDSIKEMAALTWPFLVLLAGGLAFPATRRKALAVAIPLALFAGMWVLLSSEMNRDGRFQLPGLMIAAIGATGLIPPLLHEWPRRQTPRLDRWARAEVALCVIVLFGFRVSHYVRPAEPVQADIRGLVADALRTVRSSRRVIVTTEAGLIPLRSGWTSIDAWGLNDAWIAHHGHITSARLAALDPDVIFLHAPTSPLATSSQEGQGNFLSGWCATSDTLIAYAETHGYVLVAAQGSNYQETWVSYVKAASPVAHRLIEALSHVSIAGMVNYAAVSPHLPRPPEAAHGP